MFLCWFSCNSFSIVAGAEAGAGAGASTSVGDILGICRCWVGLLDRCRWGVGCKGECALLRALHFLHTLYKLEAL